MVEISVTLSLLELVFGLGAALVAVSAWENRHKPAGYPVFVLAMAGCGYATINGLGTLVGNETATIALGHLRGPFGALIAVSVFYSAVEYTNRQGLQRPAVLAVGMAFVLLDTLAFLTNPWHELLMTDISGSTYFTATSTAWIWVHYAISFAFVLAGLVLLALKFSDRGIHRSQTAAMLVGIGIATGFFFVEAFVSFHPGFDTATFGIFLGSAVLLWAINHAGFLETVPVARETLMDTMDDYIVALDVDGRIIDANRAAMAFLDVDESILTRPAREVFADYPGLVDRFGDATEADHEFSLQRDGERRHYRLNISPITHESGLMPMTTGEMLVGRLIVVSDITERRRKEEELALLKQVFARVLRHNMRNDLNVIEGNARLLSDRVPDSERELAETVRDYSENLLEMSEKARDLESIIESPRARKCIDLGEAVDHAVADVLEAHPTARIDSQIARPCYVSVHKDIETGIRNVLENACEHDSDPPTTIEINTRIVENAVKLVIADDGPGISDHEQAVIESETETPLQHGSGLGLWIANWIVNRSKGAMDIDADAEGTRVTLSLPLEKAPDEPSRETERDSQARIST